MNFTGQWNEQQVAAAFSEQARGFDDYDAGNTIIHYKRNRVREHVLRYMPPEGSILELNAGTGTDAVWFADHGYRVHATDIAEGMQEKLKEKVQLRGMEGWVTSELCSFTELDTLKQRGPYDLIFSNFAGLNCTSGLDRVLRSFWPLLRPGGQVSLVILPGFCIWEMLMLFRGKFRTAFRRVLSGHRGAKSHVEGHHFRCWYYSPSYVKKHLGQDYEFLSVEGLCTLVPPSYIEGFAEKHPVAYRFLRVLENKWKARWPWRVAGDYYIISFRKK
ncbi:MAG TPA: class I SAM-dependent methyltransferase [Puia sp.]|jgi:ubiquinone/menaquinone biosynthesis C-methylase UbiE|nr:class I SAM-dependent methyltransferase [Puia sp.]